MFSFSASQALAAWWVTVPAMAVKYGYRKHQGPFATKAAAEAYWRAEKFGGPPIITSDGADAQQQQPDQSDPWRQEQEDERRRLAEEKAAADKAAEEQAIKDEAARKAEEARRFQKIRDDAAKQLKGFNQATGQTLKSVGGGGVSGLKEVPKPAAAAINSDPMVVDLRNLSSGLPKSVDEAIPHSPAGNRIRKGFQAIAAHDWANALLWFKDAYNREPGDPGLQRLVDLAQYTLDSQKKSQPLPAPVPTPDPVDPATDTKVAKPDEIPFTRDNPIARMAARRMAAEARVQEVYAELRRQYGHDVVGTPVSWSLETNIKKQKARDGEGLSKEELDAQFEAALTEFLKTHKTYSSGGIGGSATAEEIILGGKG